MKTCQVRAGNMMAMKQLAFANTHLRELYSYTSKAPVYFKRIQEENNTVFCVVHHCLLPLITWRLDPTGK
jgi:hypothetical protein